MNNEEITINVDISKNSDGVNQIDNSFEDISGILDMNKNIINESNETRPKHVIMLPCISVGTNNVQSISSNADNYSVATRVGILENRIGYLDSSLNTHRVNIHRFVSNPSGDGTG